MNQFDTRLSRKAFRSSLHGACARWLEAKVANGEVLGLATSGSHLPSSFSNETEALSQYLCREGQSNELELRTLSRGGRSA
jgi:hypothetical protein